MEVTRFVDQRFAKNANMYNAFRQAQGLEPLPTSYDVAIVSDNGASARRHRFTIVALVAVGAYLLCHSFGLFKGKKGA